MTPPSKELLRVLSRAKSMHQAICESALPQNWDKQDLEQMAEAGLLLWDQANELVARELNHKHALSDSISLIYEPLLTWAGHFDLSSRLARQRLKNATTQHQIEHATLSAFYSLCLQGRYIDHDQSSREETFAVAQHLFSQTPSLLTHSSSAIHKIAYGWNLIGLPDVGLGILKKHSAIQKCIDYFQTTNDPPFWKKLYVQKHWIYLLHCNLPDAPNPD